MRVCVCVTFVWFELLRWPENFACLLGNSWIAVHEVAVWVVSLLI